MRKIVLILILSFVVNAWAQDVHFSQFLANSFVLNPAMVGVQKNDYKATLQRKSQWASVSVPFTTFTLALERKDILSKTASNIQIREAIYKNSAEKYLPYKFFLNQHGLNYSWYN